MEDSTRSNKEKSLGSNFQRTLKSFFWRMGVQEKCVGCWRVKANYKGLVLSLVVHTNLVISSLKVMREVRRLLGPIATFMILCILVVDRRLVLAKQRQLF